jgi:hypothetical protein
MVGGLTGIAAGAILDGLHGFSWQLGILTLSGFHILFFVSTFFRLGAIVLARQVYEPGAESTGTLVWHLLTGAVPPAPAHWGELPAAAAPLPAAPQPAGITPGVLVHVDAAAPPAVPESTSAQTPSPIPAPHIPALIAPAAPAASVSAAR